MSASIDSLAHSFTYSSSGKSFKSAVPARQPHQNDFITFLEVARQLGLDFVHISWQPGLENAGHGATTTIRQALVDLQLSFVFKRVEISSSGNSGTDERRIFGALISEIQVLSSMRDHPNIVRLYGVYLHVDSATEKVWPVLLLEKAPHGDLRSFINYGKGQSLDLEYRLKLCWDIATAVNDMHTKGLIHGDIKPDNVLIFEGHTSIYVAKVADFGYSTVCASDDEPILIPAGTPPWAAPEWHRRNFQTTRLFARRMDAYSFGMLCLWLLFYSTQGQASERFLTDLRTKSGLDLARESVMASGFVSEKQRNQLIQLFTMTLVTLPDQRCSDFGELLQLGQFDRPQPDISLEVHFEMMNKAHSCADLFAPSTVLQLYEVDYQVRGYIAATLKKQVAELGKSTDTETASQKATFRLALCYAVGFGVDKNDEQSKHLLDRSNKQDRELKDWVDQLRDTSGYILQDDKLRRIIDEGAVNFIDYANCYREHDRLQQFEKQCAREIADTMATLHDTHIIARILKRILATVLRDQGQWNKAENLMREVIAMEEKELGPEDSVKLQSLANLSHILHKQGRLKESTELQVRVKEGSENIFGPKHLRALVSSIGLASLYRSQSKWKEAEKLQTQVKERQKEKLGDDHPSTLNTMLYLAGTYQLKGRFMEAEEMFVEIQKKSRKALGDEHDFTLTTKINLSIVYFELGRYQEAEKEQIEVLSVRKEKLGAEHPETLTTMNNLASTYSKMKPLRLEEAKEIEQEIVAVRKRKYGVKNVETLITSNNLAYTYLELGKKMEALKMQKETASAFLEESGISHVNTINALNNYVATLQLLDKSARVDKILLKLLDAMKAISEDESLPITLSINDNLAHAYRSQHRYGEAIGKFKKTYALRSQRLGEGHPDTVASKHYLNETQTSLSMTNVPAVNQPSDNQFLMELEELEREIDIQLKENMRKSKGDGIYAIGECSPD